MILKGNQTELIAEIQSVLPGYTGGRYSVRYNTDREIIEYDAEGNPINNPQSPSGWRADVIPLGNEILEPAEYDEEGNKTKEAATGEFRYDVRLPNWIKFESEFEVIDPEKQPLKALRKELKEENKRLKAENKLLRDRIADAVDFVDLKEKLTKIKDSETDPTKWSDKTDYLQGQYVEHKGIIFLVLVDHASDKDKEPPDTPEWYEEVQ